MTRPAPNLDVPASRGLLSPVGWPSLTGGAAVWVFMTVELITFGMFLVGHAWGWRVEPEAMEAGRALLHPVSATRGTVILLVGSWLAYRGVLAHESGEPRSAARWLGVAAVSGSLFSFNKIVEYGSPELADVTLSTNRFWFSYLFLTGLHLLHVLGGVALFAWLAATVGRGALPEDAPITPEAAAVYWHLVDLIWLLLFPIVYLMHP